MEPDPLKTTKQKTAVVKNSLNPVFNENFTWHLDASKLDKITPSVSLLVGLISDAF